jgi:integrase
MEGSLYQRGKGKTWYLRYDEPAATGDGRKQKNVRIGRGLTKGQAEAKKREILRRTDEGIPEEASASVTVENFLNGWLTAIRDTVAATTHARYADVVKRHVVPVIGRTTLKKVTPEHLRQVYASVRNSGLSGQTCLHVHRILHTAFEYAVRVERSLNQNVVSLNKAPKAEPRALPAMKRESVRLLIEAARGTRLEVPVAVVAVTGLRRGEVLALRWSNIDFEKRALYVEESLEQTREHGVRVKGPKSRSSRRFVPLAPEAVKLLRRHKADQDKVRDRATGVYADLDLVFPNPDGTSWPPDSFTAAFGKLAALVGLKGFRFHDLRHAFASMTLADGVSIKEVQTLMGHSSPTVTLSVYARSIEGLGRQAVNGLSRSLLASERNSVTKSVTKSA